MSLNSRLTKPMGRTLMKSNLADPVRRSRRLEVSELRNKGSGDVCNVKKEAIDKPNCDITATNEDNANQLSCPKSAPQVQGKKKIEIKPSTLVDDKKSINTERDHIKDISLTEDGTIKVDSDELDLERTLLGGQSFRWTKESTTNNGPTVFTGVISNHVFQIWRRSDDEIAFKTLNKESQVTNLSARLSLLEDYFQLKYRLKDLYKEWSARDEHLAKCCNQYKGFRILRQDPQENVFSFICATNNNIKRISLMIDKLCKRFGDILENIDGEQSVYNSYHSFPPVERLAQDDVFQCLRYELGFGYRAKFITETAKQVQRLAQENKHQSPSDYLLSLRHLSYKETCKQLMQFQGIGRKVADCICLMSMDHLNSVPIDCHIYDIVCRHYLPNLRKERKTLTDNVHDLISDHFNKLHGPLAGWSTSVLFVSDLKHLKVAGASETNKKKANKCEKQQ